jgi:dipeptidyl aminopeptidase/acylaminoacyl peptidase
MRRSLGLILLVLFVLPACAATSTRSTDGLMAESLWHWEWAGDARLSPDGGKLVYVRTVVDREKDRYRTNLWIKDLDTGRHRQLTTHEGNDRAPRWSPDGARIAFLSGRNNGSQLWVIELEGGEARRLTDMDEGVSNHVWSREGERIAFNSRSLTDEEKNVRRERAREERRRQREARGLTDGDDMESAPGPTVIERLRYQADGRPGYLPDERTHVWVVETDAEADWPLRARRVTHGDYNHGSPEWSAGGDYLFFNALLEEDADWRAGESHIYRVHVSGERAPEQLTESRRNRGRPMLSPDGRWLAYTGAEHDDPLPSYALTQLYLLRPDGSDERRLSTGYDRSVGDGTAGDMTAPTGGGDRVAWHPDSNALWFTTARDGQTHLARIAVSGGDVETLSVHAMGSLSEFSLGGSRAAFMWSAPDRPYQLHVADTDAIGRPQAWRGITDLNQAVLERNRFSDYEEVWYESFDGENIHGWVIRPPDFNPRRQYPAILYIHGGPHAMYGTSFFHEFQVLANAGYVVLITNPRGSSGYGQDFGNIIQYRYPGDDYRDLMAGVDWLLEQGHVDESRLGVTGGSGGGLLTAWTVTQTDRFAAAAAQRSVINWHSFVGTADFNLFFVQRWFDEAPWENPMSYIERSPLAYVDQVNTPILLIHSERDWRTPLEQTQQFYAQLRMQQKPARMVIFPEASHGLSRTGRPSQRVARINHLLDWFGEHLSP